MPGFPIPGRAAPELDEQLLDTILSGQHLPPDAPEQAHAVAEMLAALAGPADSGDLAGEQAALSAFALAAAPVGISHAARRPARPASWRPAALRVRLAAALVAAAAVLGGTAGAYAGVLPGPIQDLAHHAIGAPPARHVAVRPHGRHQTAYRLCTSYQRAETDHDARALAAAFQELTSAAGGAGKVGAYCTAAGAPAVLPPAHPAGHRRLLPSRAVKARARGLAKSRGKAAAHSRRPAGKGKGKDSSGRRPGQADPSGEPGSSRRSPAPAGGPGS